MPSHDATALSPGIGLDVGPAGTGSDGRAIFDANRAPWPARTTGSRRVAEILNAPGVKDPGGIAGNNRSNATALLHAA